LFPTDYIPVVSVVDVRRYDREVILMATRSG